MNYISIDPSINCTAIVINDKKFIYAKESYVYGKKGKMSKWFELCDQFIDYKIVDYPSSKDHSTNEILKLIKYDELTDIMVDDIITYSNKNEEYIIAIEGYSYNSMAGPLIDLVTLSSLLRNKIYHKISKNITIYPPSSLKKEACMLTYKPINVGKRKPKYEYKNNDGVSGGSFKKHEMFKAIIDNDTLKCEWAELLRMYKDDCLSQKNIPKPIEDINDAKLLYEIIKNKDLTNR